MDKKLKRIMKILQIILGIMLISTFAYFIVGQFALPKENFQIEDVAEILETDWVRVRADGKREPMEVPGQCEAKNGEWVTFETVLPDKQDDTCFCIRSLQQELKIYVGDELRKEYSTLDTQLFGKTSTISYVFVQIRKEDAGKNLRVESMSESSYTGYLSEIYTGEKSAIWKYFLQQNVVAFFIAVVILLLGIVVVIACLVFRFFYKRESELLYLAFAVMIASTWLLAESRLRQFILPNSTVAMHLGFYMIMLISYPFSAYMNKIQKGRHQVAFLIINSCTAVNFVLSNVLQILGIKDFYETMRISHVIIVATLVFFVLTIGLDIKTGHVKEYREVSIGLLGLVVAGFIELYLTYQNNSQYNGIALCLALVFLLLMACVKSIRDMLAVEQEKQNALAASESKAKFLASMSHEIRTPINSIIGMNEMILRENQDAAVEEYAQQIQSSSKMLLGLINDVLDFSKIEAGKLEIVENDYSVSTMLKTVVVGIQARAKKKKLILKTDIDESLPSVLKGDEIRIQQVLNNILSNAVKYTEKGLVTLSVKGIRNEETEQGFLLEMSVRDTGIGIRKEDMERLFDSFQRLELKKNRTVEGTGLGLNITKQLVEQMNGTLHVESEYGKGSCFTVRIPQQVIDGTAVGVSVKNLSSTRRSAEAVQVKRSEDILYAPDAKVLIVDDNRTNLKVMEMLLKRSKIQLDFATGGQQCLDMTKEKKYDLILMDHMMPEPDGIQTLHLLRGDKDNVNCETNVIVLTANAIAGMEEEYLKEGFADYLSKPVEVAKLESMLAKYLKNDDKNTGASM